MADKPQLIWEVGTGYDLFISLDVINNPDRYGLRGSWAAGVRSRLPAEQREVLQKLLRRHFWAIPWLISLSPPKDSAVVLQRLSQIPAEERLLRIVECDVSDDLREFLRSLVQRGAWSEDDKATLREIYQQRSHKETKKKKFSDDDLVETLEIWSQAAAYGDGLLQALNSYYEVFFAEDEARIRAGLETAVADAKQLASQLTLSELLNQLSQGLRFDQEDINKVQELILIPSFWTTPLSWFAPLRDTNRSRWVFLFGGRPASESLVPGETVPELLYQTLKALADPTRLRILRYLSQEPLTPAQLSRRLRLRPPTVIHHLDALRLARLVHLTLSHEGRRYEARREAITGVSALLEEFLAQE